MGESDRDSGAPRPPSARSGGSASGLDGAASAGRSRSLWPVLTAAALFVILLPLDLQIYTFLRRFYPHGDVRRELELLQQWGGVTTMALAIIVIALLDRPRLRRTLDWLAAAGVAIAIFFPMKMLLGRPRPEYADPYTFLGPFRTYPVSEAVGARHAWEFWRPVSNLWSMPSTHTVFAVLMSVYLCRVYPKLKPLAVGMAVLVACLRLVLGAHYATDVLMGATLGYFVASWAIDGYWGVRFVDWAWARLVDPHAVPAYPAMAAANAPLAVNRPASRASDTPRVAKPPKRPVAQKAI